jgi:hypothetical protein
MHLSQRDVATILVLLVCHIFVFSLLEAMQSSSYFSICERCTTIFEAHFVPSLQFLRVIRLDVYQVLYLLRGRHVLR